MAPLRIIYCSNCGTKLQVPEGMEPSRLVRCRMCECVFPVPPVMEVRVEKEPTGAQEYVIDDMPTALRQALTGAFEQEDEEAIQKAAETQVPLPDAPRARIRNKGSEPVERMGTDTRRRLNRRAFNLESEDDPNHRTGAGLVQVPKLENLDDQEP